MARSHLFPKRLMHDIRREAKHLIGIRGGGRRIGLLQSGETSQKILCHKHEGATQRFDDAAIRLMRSFTAKRKTAYEGLGWLIPNSKPRDLGLFVHASIWRHWASWYADETGPLFPRDLIPALQRIVFDDAVQFPTIMLHAGRTHDGGEALFALAPTVSELEGIPVTRFEIGGFVFLMFHDHRELVEPWNEFQTNHDPLVILQLEHGELRSDPNIMRFVRAAQD